jgi:hypothetical protein
VTGHLGQRLFYTANLVAVLVEQFGDVLQDLVAVISLLDVDELVDDADDLRVGQLLRRGHGQGLLVECRSCG